MFFQFLREPVHSSEKSAAIAAFAARVVGFRGHVVILSFGFLRVPRRGGRTIEWLCLGRRCTDDWLNEYEGRAVGRLFVKIVSLVANGVALAALQPMIVVIENFSERTAINHRLITLETFTLFSFERFDCN